jgi:hypothetical protein
VVALRIEGYRMPAADSTSSDRISERPRRSAPARWAARIGLWTATVALLSQLIQVPWPRLGGASKECAVFLVDQNNVPWKDLLLDADGALYDEPASNGRLPVPCSLHGKRVRVQTPRTGQILAEPLLDFSRDSTVKVEIHR